MKKKKVNIKSLVDEFKSETDKMGSYTGVPSGRGRSVIPGSERVPAERRGPSRLLFAKDCRKKSSNFTDF